MARSAGGDDHRKSVRGDVHGAGVRDQAAEGGARPDLDRGPADSPTDLSKPSIFAVLKRSGKRFSQANLTDLAAALTYYAVLSIVPGLIVMVSALAFLSPDATTEITDQVQELAPGSAADFVRTLIDQAQANQTGAGIGAIVGIAIALWSASTYVAAFMRASNVIYGIGEGRPIWKTVPIRVGVTIMAVVLLLASAVIVVVSGPIAVQIGDVLGAGDTALLVWRIAKWPVLLIIVSVLLAILFWASPNAKQSGVKWVSPGGVIAVLIWLVASGLFAVYVANFSSYDKTYGSLAGIVIFLVWLWLSNIAVLLGAVVNAELEHAKAIADGLPEDIAPFTEPRDSRKLDRAQQAAVDASRSAKEN